MMFAHMKLGRNPARMGLALPTVRDLVPNLPPARSSGDWSLSVGGWNGWGNDRIGLCTYAAAANCRWQTGVYAGHVPAITEAEVIHEYALGTGYTPMDASTDRGQVEVDLLHDWLTRGFTFGGATDRIAGYAAEDHTDVARVRACIDAFGGVMIGAALPISAQLQGVRWTKVGGRSGEAGGWGGHEMWCNGHSDAGAQVVSWGERITMTWEWFLAYVEEVQAVFHEAWIEADGHTPLGLDRDVLAAAMTKVAS